MSSQLAWKSIRSFKGSQHKGFEQLCFQLALRLYQHQGDFTEVDDTGGGDGVEFYMKRDNEKECGWQAKFYDQSSRLSESGRKAKILGSLKTSLAKHPKLEKWILCTNSQFTPDEQKWFSQLKSHIPKGRKVALEHWSEGKIQNWLDHPEHAGIKHAFFGKLQLNPEWFQSKFDKVKHLVEEKYIHELHTKDHDLYRDYLGPLLVNADFLDRCKQNLNNIETAFKRYEDAVDEIKTTSYTGMEWHGRASYVQFCDKGATIILGLLTQLKEVLKLITPNQIDQARKYEKEPFQDPINELITDLNRTYSQNQPRYLTDYVPETEDDKNRLLYASNKITSIKYRLEAIAEEIGYFIRDLDMTDKHHFHLLGNAGIGKTHIGTSIAREYLDLKKPTIFIPGIKFNEYTTIENQVLDMLDIKSNYTFSEFLETLNVLGRVCNARVPIIIDGLNESVNDRGILNPIWKRDIRGLEKEIEKLSHVSLFTTCRISYQTEIWPKEESSNIHRYYGFSYEEDRKTLINRYFVKYRIHADLTYLSLSNFAHPLFLKIFCETKSILGKDVYLQIGSDSIYDIFGQFIQKCDSSVYDRLKGFGQAPVQKNRKLASNISFLIGQQLWMSNARLLSFESYQRIFNEPEGQSFFTSKAKALIDEGLLLMRDWTNQEEHIGFTYDMIGGYCIANYLIEIHGYDLKTLVTGTDFTERLASDNFETRHPLAEDILDCFMALLPVKTDKHLLDFLPKKKIFRRLASDSFLTFFKVSGKYIRRSNVKKTSSVFNKGPADQRQIILEKGREIFFVPSHPLNFLFFSNELLSLSLTEKDLCWCEFLRSCNENYLSGIIEAFEVKNHPANSFTIPEQEAVNDIVAEFIVWSLASNLIVYRNNASKALYIYGRKHPEKFFKLLSKFAHADDVYIRERLMAVAFGLVTAFCKEVSNRDFIVKTTLWTYRMFFASRASLSTTHVLLRDYASQLVEAGFKQYSSLLKSVHLDMFRSPFTRGGIRKWKIAIDNNRKDYREGNSLIDFFFEKDELPRLIKHDYYKPNKRAQEAKGRILWRAYNLGYRFSDFMYVDQSIYRWRGYGRHDDKKVEKYAEKYVWIAYYELAGYMDDLGLIERYSEYKWPVRAFGEGFDPTFPDPLVTRQYFDTDTIGNKKISIASWLKAKNIPEVKNLLVVNNLTDSKEQYVLMEAFKCQTDEKAQRQLFFWLNAIFVKNEHYVAAKKAIVDRNVAGDVQPNYHETIYSGEYPDSDYFPCLAQRDIEWDYKKVRIKRKYSRQALFLQGKPLSEKKQEEFWKKMEDKFHYEESGSRKFQKEWRDKSGKLIGPVAIRICYSDSPKNLSSLITDELKKRKYQIKTIYKYKYDWENLTSNIPIFMPTIDSKAGTTIAKEICEILKLKTRPGSTDLYDTKGNQASIFFRYGDKYQNNHKFLYLRKDLLDQFLKKEKLKMFWSFEGEWNHWIADGLGSRSPHPHWRKFKKTVNYLNNIKPPAG